MSAGAATQFHFDTVIHFTSAAQVDQAKSFTDLLTVLEETGKSNIQLFMYFSGS